jgi:hypothetical protein
MAILSVPWDLRALWSISSGVAKAYLFFLFVIAGYTIRALIKRGQAKRIQQVHYFCLLLFGIVFSNECFGVLRTIQLSRASLSAIGIESLEPAVAFSFIAFTILGFLHVLQWFGTSHHS